MNQSIELYAESILPKQEEFGTLVEYARALDKMFSSIDKDTVLRFFVLGGVLTKIREKELYKRVYGAKTWGEYLAVHKKSRSFAYRAMKTWEYFVVRYNFPMEELMEINERGYNFLLPRIKEDTPREQVSEYMEKFKALSEADFRIEMTGHEHELESIQGQKCKNCNFIKLTPEI
jgi:hypothetical protein